MDALMMDYQLTLPTILRRTEAYFGAKEVVTRLPDKSFHRYTYSDMQQLVAERHLIGVAAGKAGDLSEWTIDEVTVDDRQPSVPHSDP